MSCHIVSCCVVSCRVVSCLVFVCRTLPYLTLFVLQVQKDRLPEKVNFRVSIPNAEAVAVVSGQEWTHLERGEGNEWSGPVKVSHCYGTNNKVTLNANFGGDKTSYATLLEYGL